MENLQGISLVLFFYDCALILIIWGFIIWRIIDDLIFLKRDKRNKVDRFVEPIKEKKVGSYGTVYNYAEVHGNARVYYGK
jgi:hypothetical protein